MNGRVITKSVLWSFALGLTLIGTLQVTHAAEVVQWYHTDAAGTPVAMTDSAGNVIWRQSQQPFGVPQSTTGSTTNPLGFTGKPVDPETGLVDLGARWYSPKLGRFLQVDPALRGGIPEAVLREPQRLNPYAYGLNNPYRYTDPDGQLAETLWDIISIGYSAYQLYQEPSWANVGWLAVDVAAALTPFVPAVGGVRIVGKGAEKAGEAAKAVGGEIKISEGSLAHVLERHSVGGSKTRNKSVFSSGEDIPSLIRQAEKVDPVQQAGGKLERIVDAGRPIGVDRATGKETSKYTIITDATGNLITAFPGVP